VEEWDRSISATEVADAIKSLKRDKSAGLDDLVCELFLDAIDMITQPLCNLFNCVYDNGVYPVAWSNCIVVPVPKKSDTTEAGN
jgi:hypothetical protein